EVCTGLRLPALEKLLARGQAGTGPVVSMEDWLCSAFGATAVAPVRAVADGLDTSDGYWLCADPVNLQLHRAQMMLMPDVAATQEEAAALCDNLNAHFAGQGMRFFVPYPQRWYLRLEAAPQLTTVPLRQAAWQDAKFHQPQGADTLHWQRVMTEVQMLLYAHPFNQAREARGEVLINSLWLWGGGHATPFTPDYSLGLNPSQPPLVRGGAGSALPLTRGSWRGFGSNGFSGFSAAFDAVGGDSALGRSFAHAAGVPLLAGLQDMLQGAGTNGLWLNEAMGDAQQRGDYHAWREAVLQFERDCGQLWQALRAGRLQRLTLEVSGENGLQHFELSRASTWRFWRPSRSLPHYAV
ncbi:MAG: hypothetical protein Q8L69_01285, partial [Gallionellaceae bacterium]|nr:hypothetical protein [Gallionellaceae bacterium]